MPEVSGRGRGMSGGWVLEPEDGLCATQAGLPLSPGPEKVT